MKALCYHEFRGPVRVEYVADPQVPDDGAVIRVAASGLCRSDWHAWAGHDDCVAVPHVPGHEFCGVIEAVGPSVRRWAPGARVTAPFINGCGDCGWCRSGQAQVCPQQTQPGFTHWGSHAEFVAIRGADTNLVALPESLPDAAAAALGCRFATAFHALTGRARIREGQWVAVFGAGGVGLSAVAISRALGARVVVVDPSERARELALLVGAEYAIDSSAAVSAAVADLTGGGADVSVDALGSAAIATTAILSLRRRGIHLQIGLLAEPDTTLPLGHAIAWELDILGCHGMPALDYPAMLALIGSGHVDIAGLLGSTVGFTQAAALLPETDTATARGIVVLDPRQP
ncbi:MAG: alcohol dehydrogenase catalytic domain-containing protein [Gordonia sp. (in: high G+C Gram-positive bacteria)]